MAVKQGAYAYPNMSRLRVHRFVSLLSLLVLALLSVSALADDHASSTVLSPESSPLSSLDVEMEAAVLREVLEFAHQNDIGTFTMEGMPSVVVPHPSLVASPESKRVEIYVEKTRVEKSWFSNAVGGAIKGRFDKAIGFFVNQQRAVNKKVVTNGLIRTMKFGSKSISIYLAFCFPGALLPIALMQEFLDAHMEESGKKMGESIASAVDRWFDDVILPFMAGLTEGGGLNIAAPPAEEKKIEL